VEGLPQALKTFHKFINEKKGSINIALKNVYEQSVTASQLRANP